MNKIVFGIISRIKTKFGRAFVPIFSRLVVYFLGFISVLILSKLLTPEEFGKFSIGQSIIEFGIICCTLGSGLLYTSKCNSTTGLVRFNNTIYFGCALSIFVVSALYIVFLNGEDISIALILILVVMVSSILSILLYQYRSLGGEVFFINEPGLKSFILVLVFLSFSTLYGSQGFYLATVSYLISVVISLGILVVILIRKELAFGNSEVGIKQQFEMFASGIFGFLSKKSDILIVSIFLSYANVAEFKISFLLAEVPLQLCAAWLVYKTKKIKECSEDFCSNQIQLISKEISVLFFVFAIPILFVYYLMGYYYDGEYNLSSSFWFLLLYFFARSFVIVYEPLLIFKGLLKEFKIVSGCNAFVKIVLLILVGEFFPEMIYWAYPILGAFEIFIFSRLIRAQESSRDR